MADSPKYISHGAYGCILRPNISCKNKKESESNKISKIFEDHKNAKKEIKSQKKMKKIDPYSEFTVNMFDYCQVNIDPVYNEIRKCPNFDSKLQGKYTQIIYEYGGIPLSLAINKVDPMILFPAFGNLLKGLIVMKKHKQCHLDIKPDNIVFNLETKKMAFIDFGLTTHFKRVYDKRNMFVLSSSYAYYPPEFQIGAAHVQKKELDEFDIDFIDVEAMQIYNKLKKFINKFYMETHWMEVYVNFTELVHKRENLKQFLVPSAIDLYSLGITMLKLLATRNAKFGLAGDILLFIRQLINPNPLLRPSAEDAFANYKKIWK